MVERWYIDRQISRWTGRRIGGLTDREAEGQAGRQTGGLNDSRSEKKRDTQKKNKDTDRALSGGPTY